MGLKELEAQKQQQVYAVEALGKKIGKLGLIRDHLEKQLKVNPAYLQTADQETFKKSLETSLSAEAATLLLTYISGLRASDKQNGNPFDEQDFGYRLSFQIEYDSLAAMKKQRDAEGKIEGIDLKISKLNSGEGQSSHNETNSPSPNQPKLRKQVDLTPPGSPSTGKTLVQSFKGLFSSSSGSLPTRSEQQQLLSRRKSN